MKVGQKSISHDATAGSREVFKIVIQKRINIRTNKGLGITYCPLCFYMFTPIMFNIYMQCRKNRVAYDGQKSAGTWVPYN